MSRDLPTQYLRGEIWWINFDPTIGDEIQKTRPGVVINIRHTFRNRVRLVVPITSWQEKFTDDFWMVKLPASSKNGLSNDSAANAYQVRALSEKRFIGRLGSVTDDELEEIVIAVAICIGLR